MFSLCQAIKNKDKPDEGVLSCLNGLAMCRQEDVVFPLVFLNLLDEYSQNLKGIREMDKETYQNVNPIPIPKNFEGKIQTELINEKVPNIEAKKVSNRLTIQQEKYTSKNIEPTAVPSFQTALAATGKKKEIEEIDDRLKGIEPRLIEIIENEIFIRTTGVSWNDIAGLDGAKQAVQEAIILPMKFPDLFTGLREPPRGVLFFGPPGTGKTMIAKALATESKCTFFNISASSLTSKWVGEGEKLTRALFAVARVKSPAIVFIDEIDSLLTRRSENDFEASRRVKTEFLLQFDGVGSGAERILVLGATNRPQDLDEAARRRFTKRIYIPLPDYPTRLALVEILLKKASHSISNEEIKQISAMTEGYSCADITTLMRESAMVPLREISIENCNAPNVRPLSYHDIEIGSKSIRPSVSPDSLNQYMTWNSEFGYSST